MRIRPRGADRWALSGRYVEFVWSEVLGPTATLLARRVEDLIERHPDGIQLSLSQMGGSLGIAPSKVRAALRRLDRYGLVILSPASATVGVSGLAPSVGHELLAGLTDPARREHLWQLGAASSPSPPQAARSGARSTSGEHRGSRQFGRAL